MRELLLEKTCSSASFKALMLAQFMGALNDNIYKLAVSLIAMAMFVTQDKGTLYISLASALFALPFIIFAPYGGFLADRFSKTRTIQWLKALEIAVMGGAFVALSTKNIQMMFVMLFLMGFQSALFGPSKYGIMPELLEHHHLSKGNGYMQFWTFSAIILGTACGGQLVAVSGGDYRWVGYAVLAIAAVGFTASLFIAKTPPADIVRKFDFNGFGVMIATLKEIAKDGNLFLAMIASMYFAFIGSFLQMNILLHAKQMLFVGESHVSMMLLVLALGIGIGSVVAGKISEGKVELGLVPMGAFGLAAFSFGLGLLPLSFEAVLAVLFFMGISGGVYIVPLNAFIQHWSPQDLRGRFLAANTFLSFSAILVSSFIFWLLKEPVGMSSGALFVLAGMLTAAMLWVILGVLPSFFVRCVNWILTHTIYRLKVLGDDNVPERGGALLVANHASYADPSILMASIDRSIRFLTDRAIYEFKLLKPFAKAVNAIPVSSKDSPKTISESLQIAAGAIKNGELVCIFAEGGHTRTGQLLEFKSGLEKIMEGVDAPIIPVHLDKVWGSVLSYKGGKYFWKVPSRIPYPVTVAFGKPLPPGTKASRVRLAVQELSSQTFAHRSEIHRYLHQGLLDQVKLHPFKACITDTLGLRLNYAQMFAGALSLSKKLRDQDEEYGFSKGTEAAEGEREMVGVVLPSSAAAALVNIAVLIAGKIPVNLNFTTSKESIVSSIQQCKIRKIITSRKFIQKIGWEAMQKMVYVEDILAGITKLDRLLSYTATLVLPKRWILRLYYKGKVMRNQTATIIFSSGSTGEPKGVMLTHENISSNVQAVYDVVRMRKDENIVGVLPFFHSFGFTGTLWLPLLAGIKVVYHMNPLDASTIGKMVQANKGTILISTPTFLSSYIRKCTPEQFATLRHVIVGAEKLKDSIAGAFKDKFGLEPLEGYGATELSPIAALNIENFRSRGINQIGAKRGKIGRPLPGVAVKIVDPNTRADLGSNQDGLLLVKGPNVMKGYLNREDLTREVIQDGWYSTGDIANVDDEGFVMITDRLSRFSKIGGEMVPHVRVEDALHQATGVTERVFAVTSVPDEKKGEKLVVLHTIDMDVDQIIEKLSSDGLPSLWVPKKDQYFLIESLPILGSGKIDLKAVKKLGMEKLGVSNA